MRERLVPATILFLGCVAIVFVFAYWMKERDDKFAQEIRGKMSQFNLSWQTWEKNAHLKYVSHDELSSAHLKMSDSWREMFDSVCRGSEKMRKDTKKEIEAVQDHCAKLREGQFDLQNQVSKKRPLIKLPTGPIQVEIYTPSKNMGGKKQPKKGGREVSMYAVFTLNHDQGISQILDLSKITLVDSRVGATKTDLTLEQVLVNTQNNIADLMQRYDGLVTEMQNMERVINKLGEAFKGEDDADFERVGCKNPRPG